jgi:4-nitrophenyl phosphatase
MFKTKISQIQPSLLGLILDMDGVLWRDNTPIGNLSHIFESIASRGIRIALATNNSTKTVPQYLSKLDELGVVLEPWQIVTSSSAVTDLLIKKFPNRGEVFMIGEDGVRQSLKDAGFDIALEGETSKAVAVVVGIDREINYNKLKEATLLIRRGLPFFGTNADLTFPSPDGLIPGAGSFLALLAAATGVTPIVAGKPSPEILELALKRLGTPRAQTLVVGDRLETDIAGGQSIGCPTALVLSGVSTREMGASWNPKVDIIADDLSSLIA